MNKEEEQECHFSINEYVSDEWLKTKQIIDDHKRLKQMHETSNLDPAEQMEIMNRQIEYTNDQYQYFRNRISKIESELSDPATPENDREFASLMLKNYKGLLDMTETLATECLDARDGLLRDSKISQTKYISRP